MKFKVTDNITDKRHCSGIIHLHLYLKAIIFLLLTFISITLPAYNPKQKSEYDVKAVFITRILPYIEWPEESGISYKTKPFTIVILGRNPFGSVLEDIYSSEEQKVKNKTVVIQYVKDIDDINQCDLLFIANHDKEKLYRTLLYVKGKPILTVSDTKGFGQEGVHVNFYIKDNKTRFEFNEQSASNDGFKVDYRLRNIAKIVGLKKGK